MIQYRRGDSVPGKKGVGYGDQSLSAHGGLKGGINPSARGINVSHMRRRLAENGAAQQKQTGN
jgi:hypothetical protein